MGAADAADLRGRAALSITETEADARDRDPCLPRADLHRARGGADHTVSVAVDERGDEPPERDAGSRHPRPNLRFLAGHRTGDLFGCGGHRVRTRLPAPAAR